MELTPRQRAEKAVEHARAGTARARTLCGQKWAEWLGATEFRRKALEIETEAESALRLLVEDAVPHARLAPASMTVVVAPPRERAGDFVPADETAMPQPKGETT